MVSSDAPRLSFPSLFLLPLMVIHILQIDFFNLLLPYVAMGYPYHYFSKSISSGNIKCYSIVLNRSFAVLVWSGYLPGTATRHTCRLYDLWLAHTRGRGREKENTIDSSQQAN